MYYIFFFYMFQCLLHYLQGERFYAQNIITFYDYMGLQLFYSYIKNNVCFKVEHHVPAELMRG